MQTSITTWFKKSAAVKQSTAPSSVTNQESLDTQPPASKHQNGSTTSSSPQQQPPQPTLNTPQDSSSTTIPNLQLSTRQKPLINNITLTTCDKSTIQSFERLNTLLLPIPYPSTFYKEILSDPVACDLTLLAVWHDTPSSAPTTPGKVIGGIRCRILSDPSTQATPKDKILYIGTLGVLSAFRGYGVASALLGVLIERGISKYGVNAVGAHVWEASPEAREWYAKRGFRETHLESHYYRRLTPQGAYVLRRDIGPRDLLHTL